VRVPGVRVAQVLQDGRLKTQFETGHSQAVLDTQLRRNAERNGLGIPTNVAVRERPVCGYFETSMTEGTTAYKYGRAIFELKPAVRARTTVSYGDSLYGMDEGMLYPAPCQAIDSGAVSDPFALDAMANGDFLELEVGGYAEAQIQGGVSMADVSRIIWQETKEANELALARGNFPRGLWAAASSGIPLRVELRTARYVPAVRRLLQQALGKDAKIEVGLLKDEVQR
jgi:hypothetical protein